MSKNLLDTQLDCLEAQVSELSASLIGADPRAVQAGGIALQRLAVELVQMASGTGHDQLSSLRHVQKTKALSVGIAALRETLLRRMSYVDRALEVVMPESRDKATYAGGSAYGRPVRQSGAFSVLSA